MTFEMSNMTGDASNMTYDTADSSQNMFKDNLQLQLIMNLCHRSETGQTCDHIVDMEDFSNCVLDPYAIPLVGLFGIIGNSLNMVVLVWRYRQRKTDMLERGALLGLIGLAISDLTFCLGITPKAIYHETTSCKSIDFHCMYQMYGMYVTNLALKISTWLTMLIAVARYVVICHPLQARRVIGLWTTKLAIVITYIFWAIILLPMLWIYKLDDINEIKFYFRSNDTQAASPTTGPDDEDCLLIGIGPFGTSDLVMVFSCIWALVGTFLPLAVMTFSNVCLIRALLESAKLRERHANSYPLLRKANAGITRTLIALIVLFTALVLPSEILFFYNELNPNKEVYNKTSPAMAWINLMVATNFASHFVLYCTVNSSFRKTMVAMNRSAVDRCRGRDVTIKGRGNTFQMSTTGATYYPPDVVESIADKTSQKTSPISEVKCSFVTQPPVASKHMCL